jgi:hypothetical protein
LKSIGRDWRKYKATLKKALFNPKKKKSVLNKRCPTDIEEDEWKALVNYWKSKEGKVRHHCSCYLHFYYHYLYYC